MNNVIIYYGSKRGKVTKLTYKYRKRHLLKDKYVTECGRKIIDENSNGNKSWKYNWRDTDKESWANTDITDCELCIKTLEKLGGMNNE